MDILCLIEVRCQTINCELWDTESRPQLGFLLSCQVLCCWLQLLLLQLLLSATSHVTRVACVMHIGSPAANQLSGCQVADQQWRVGKKIDVAGICNFPMCTANYQRNSNRECIFPMGAQISNIALKFSLSGGFSAQNLAFLDKKKFFGHFFNSQKFRWTVLLLPSSSDATGYQLCQRFGVIVDK